MSNRQDRKLKKMKRLRDNWFTYDDAYVRSMLGIDPMGSIFEATLEPKTGKVILASTPLFHKDFVK